MLSCVSFEQEPNHFLLVVLTAIDCMLLQIFREELGERVESAEIAARRNWEPGKGQVPGKQTRSVSVCL